MEGSKLKTLGLNQFLWNFVFLVLASTSLYQARAEVEFDSSIMPSERKIVRGDFEILKQLKSDSVVLGDFQNRSKALQNLKQKPADWLFQRLLVLVGPLNRSGLVTPTSTSVMRNLGALLSNDASPSHALNINSRKVIVSGPEMGIIQFTKNPSEVLINPKKNSDALVNSIYRLGLLFHDARHSDGKAESRGIPHIQCPENHAFRGFPICDAYVDGSFGAEVLIGQALLNQFRDQLDAADLKLIESWINSRKRHIVGTEIYGE